jgi:hypothetical protein
MRRTKTDNSYVLNYELNDNYPLIPNQNTYFKQEKMICINSEDRNIIKYPQSNSFEILLPTDIVNVSAIQLKNWMFPINTNTFSYSRNNLQLEFRLQPLNEYLPNLFDPLGTTGNVVDENYIQIVNDVIKNSNTFIATINEGTYTDTTLSYEIQNQMNVVVDKAIAEYIIKNHLQSDYTPYVFFKVIISGSENRFWFVNTLNPFEFNDSKLYKTNTLIGEVFNPCSNDKKFTSYSYYGLPAYLGFQELPAISGICMDKYELTIMSNLYSSPASPSVSVDGVPNSYVSLPVPSFQQNIVNGKYVNVNFIKPLNTYTLTLYTHIYLELETLNCGDETKPFTNNEFTRATNQGNGSVDSFIGRIPLFSTNSADYATSNGGSEKQPTSYFNPPLERLRKFKINLRYHDGSNVNFGLNNWDFALTVTSYLPTQNKKITNTPF